jgi:hypothetical protein
MAGLVDCIKYCRREMAGEIVEHEMYLYSAALEPVDNRLPK